MQPGAFAPSGARRDYDDASCHGREEAFSDAVGESIRVMENPTTEPTAAVSELVPVDAGVVLARGEILDPGSLAARATEVAHRQPSPATRATYAGVYRAMACSSARGNTRPVGLWGLVSTSTRAPSASATRRAARTSPPSGPRLTSRKRTPSRGSSSKNGG